MRSTLAALLTLSFSLPAASTGAESGVPMVDHPDVAPTVEGKAPEGVSPADWASIRAAYEAGRHQVFAVDGGHRARNPGQQWTTVFDGRGFTTTPDAGGWSWGLELVRYGWGADQQEVARPLSVSAEGGRVDYAWDECLSEWYINDVRGLEHGYTVAARPQGASSPLVIVLSTRGELAPAISADGRDVRFLDPAGATAVTYAGLAVVDADGRKLDARWGSKAGGLQLEIDDRAARYPLTIDPLAQQAYLTPSVAGGQFGWAISISGDTVVVGSRFENSNATGVNGDENNQLAPGSGAAYVFVRNGTSWSQEAYLKASNTGANDHFGRTVSISGDTIVVGAHEEDSNSTGVNGDESNDLATDAGAAYVFVRNGTSWSQEAYLKASNTETVDQFGYSVSVSGDTLVVSAMREDSNATGVNGNQSNNSVADSGAAYVFVRSGTTWSQEAYVKASNTGSSSDLFGFSISISGDTLAVAAVYEDSNATGVNGAQNNELSQGSGAAYVFVRNGTTWSQEAYLKASNTGPDDRFGWSLSNSGDTVVVGAYQEDSNSTGVNGAQNNELASNSGAAYVFARSGTSWSQEAYLKASNSAQSDEFGQAVSVSGDMVLVGAEHEDSNATGVNGDQSNNLASNSGAAYVFVRNGTTWSQEAYLKASNTLSNAAFGSSVSVSGDTVVVGSSSANAAYVFDLYDSVVYCTAGTSAAGCQASISSTGVASATASSGFTLAAGTVEGQKDGLFFFGTNGQQANPWGNGTSYQCVIPPVVRTPTTAGVGTIGLCDGSFALDLNALWCPACPKPGKNPGVGATVQAQLWYRDPASTSNQTTSLSDAIEFVVAP